MAVGHSEAKASWFRDEGTRTFCPNIGLERCHEDGLSLTYYPKWQHGYFPQYQVLNHGLSFKEVFSGSDSHITLVFGKGIRRFTVLLLGLRQSSRCTHVHIFFIRKINTRLYDWSNSIFNFSDGGSSIKKGRYRECRDNSHRASPIGPNYFYHFSYHGQSASYVNKLTSFEHNQFIARQPSTFLPTFLIFQGFCLWAALLLGIEAFPNY